MWSGRVSYEVLQLLMNSEQVDFSLWHIDLKEVKVREKGEGKKRGVQERQYVNKCKKNK